MSKAFNIKGQIIDIQNNRIFGGEISVINGRIYSINECEDAGVNYILPGFIDAHIHIESSMLTPYEFARKALTHGTIATVSDPHEIANVCGMEGVFYMIENAKEAKLKFNFGAPSCVPATDFETAGAFISVNNIELLMQRDDIKYLSEMMNYPGVLHEDPIVLQKIETAKKNGKPIDGHAPGIMGKDAEKYIKSGISTDHECFTKAEALHKLKNGMKVLIREGSAARNFDELHELISEYPKQVMLCSDDKHPDELMHGHINQLVTRAINLGHNLFNVLQCACINPVEHYKLEVGILREGDPADFIVVDSPENFNIIESYINGEKVVENGKSILPEKKHTLINNFSCSKKQPGDFVIPVKGSKLNVIEAIDGQLITQHIEMPVKIDNGNVISDVDNDVLKIVVVNRYRDELPAVGFIKNFNFKSGAIASTVAHDSHNIIAVGVDDTSICEAINLLIESKGGLSVVNRQEQHVIPLPIAGLMSDLDCESVGKSYIEIDKKVKGMGCNLRAPFMTLSFMALLVIPNLKLSDKGLFNGNKFEFMPLMK